MGAVGYSDEKAKDSKKDNFYLIKKIKCVSLPDFL